MATRKTPARKRKTSKPARRKTASRSRKPTRALTAFEEDLPPRLGQFARRLRLGLIKLEKQVVSARADYAKRSARMLREASQELGRLEERGEKEWKRLSRKARGDAARLLRRIEKAVEPARKKSRKKKAARRPARKRTRPAVEARGSGI